MFQRCRNTHVLVQTPRGLLIDCSVSSTVEANWKPNFQVVAEKVRMLDMQSCSPKGETRSWVSLFILCWAWRNGYWECLCTQLELPLCFVWCQGTHECQVPSVSRARSFGVQWLCGNHNSWGAKCVIKLLSGRIEAWFYSWEQQQRAEAEDVPTSSVRLLGGSQSVPTVG